MKSHWVWAVLFCSFFLPAMAEARLDPRLQWRTLETAHFLVHYHNGLEAFVPPAARIAEEAHRRLAPTLRWEPADKTHLVLADVSDAPNGFATPFPFNRIVIYLTPPLEQPFSLTDREDWLRLVITHEYTHILHLDTVHGLPRRLRHILGRAYFPNLFQPAWIIEGLATHQETLATEGGRGRSSYGDMVLRMAVLEKRFPTLAQAGVFLDSWPAGETPYLFGAGFFKHLTDTYGPDLPAAISTTYAGRSLPFMVDSTARRVFGSTFKVEWPRWRDRLAEHYRMPAEGTGTTVPTLLTDDGYRNIFPALSPAGDRLAYSSQTADRVSSLVLAEINGYGGKVAMRRLVTADGAGIAWHGDGSALVYGKLEQDRYDNLTYDLFRYELATGRETRLTQGVRASSPDVSPRTGDIACVTTGGGRSRLALISADGAQVRHLSAMDDPLDYFSPRWSPDGEQIAVGTRAPGGIFTIVVLDGEGRLLTAVPHGPGSASAPAWSPDGSTIFFSADLTGIFNIYAYRPGEKTLYQVTDLRGGAFSPAVSPDGATLFFSSYGAAGFDLATLPLLPGDWRPVETPTVTTSITAQSPLVDREGKGGEESLSATTYSPWRALLPRHWLPWLGDDEDGLQIGAITSGIDPLQRHQYTALLLYGPNSGRPAYSLLYQYDGLTPSVQVFAADQATFTADFFRPPGRPTADLWERRRFAGVDFAFPFPGLWTRHSIIPGYRFQRFDSLTETPAGGVAPAEGNLSGVRLRYLFDNTVLPPRAVSAEDGRRAEAAMHHDLPLLGSDFTRSRFTLDWREFTSLPWSHHQVLATRIFGGVATGDVLPQRAFRVGGDPAGDLLQGVDGEYLPLRGYRLNAFRGQRAALGSIEYRFPLLNIERAAGNGPLFLRRLHGAAFFEGADAFDSGGPNLADFRTAAGLETRLDADIGYILPVTLRLVLARGFDQGGEDQLYFSLWFRL